MLTAVVVLAGGTSQRLGRDKLAEPLTGGPTGPTVLAHLLADLRRQWPERPVRVVGPDRGHEDGVELVREDPPGGGPAAGLAAGLQGLPDDGLVAVLAGDQPFAAAALAPLVAALVSGAGGAGGGDLDGAVAVDGSGVPQPLLAIYRCGPLRSALGPSPAGRSVRAVLAGLRLVEVPTAAGLTLDVDTEADLERARERALQQAREQAGQTRRPAGAPERP